MTERKTPLLARIGRRQIGSDAPSSLPVYHQLHLIISQRIRDRVYLPAALLPSEFALATQFGLSRVTVRRTLALLDVPLGSALVLLRRTARDANHAPLLFQQSLYRPDRYEYHMLLTREQSAERLRWQHLG